MIVSNKFFYFVYLSNNQYQYQSVEIERGVLRRKYCKQCVYNVGAS